jgi:toxin ParE1/3/4
MTVEWTDAAMSDLEEAYEYIANSSGPTIARTLVERVFLSVDHLTAFPQSGLLGRVQSTREVVTSHTPFIAAYAVESNHVVILAVLHGAQLWPDSF